MQIILYGSLSRKLGKVLEIDADGQKTIRDILQELSTKEPELKPDNPNILVFINDAEASLLGGLSYRPKNEDKIAVLPVAHGGAQ
ncbi:MAG: MoaD/ThiS family protein [Nitrososphaeria archaeon]|nr:MoaD/ThiS family protein [Conexivisphaerales archaeon]